MSTKKELKIVAILVWVAVSCLPSYGDHPQIQVPGSVTPSGKPSVIDNGGGFKYTYIVMDTSTKPAPLTTVPTSGPWGVHESTTSTITTHVVQTGADIPGGSLTFDDKTGQMATVSSNDGSFSDPISIGDPVKYAQTLDKSQFTNKGAYFINGTQLQITLTNKPHTYIIHNATKGYALTDDHSHIIAIFMIKNSDGVWELDPGQKPNPEEIPQ